VADPHEALVRDDGLAIEVSGEDDIFRNSKRPLS